MLKRKSRLLDVFAFLLSVFSPTVVGDTEESIAAYIRMSDERIAKAVASIPSLVERYANTLGCAYAMQPENVVPYVIKKIPVHVALYALDRGCSGGSSMQRAEIAVVVRGASDRLFVEPDFSRTLGLRPSIVDRIFLQDGVLRYEGRNLKGSDALCCPSEQIHGQLDFDGSFWNYSTSN